MTMGIVRWIESTPRDLAALGPSGPELAVRFCDLPDVVDDDLAALDGHTLEGLSLAFMPGITDRGLSHIARQSALRILGLMQLQQITSLELGKVLAKLPALESLGLTWCYQLTDEVFDGIVAANSKLSDISLDGFHELSDRTLTFFGSLPHLRELSLPPSEAFGASLQPLVARFSDNGFVSLAHSKSLEKLTIVAQRGITASVLEAFAAMKTLRELRVDGCANINSSDLLRFAKRAPWCATYDSELFLAEPIHP